MRGLRESRACVVCGDEFEAACMRTQTCDKKGCRYTYRSALAMGLSIKEYQRRQAAKRKLFEQRRALALQPAQETPLPGEAEEPAAPGGQPAPGPAVPPRPREKVEWRAPSPPAPTAKTGRYERILFVPDIHCGDQDDRAVALALAVAKHVKPDRVIQLGDALDFYGLSRFDTNPMRFAYRLQDELDIQHEVYRALTEATPGALRQQIIGNHEERGVKLMWRIPTLGNLRLMALESLMDLANVGFEPKVYDSIILANGAFIARHGTFVWKWAGYSAKAELDSTHVSGISGHTHRQSLYSLSTEAGELVWCEAGHLQKNPPEWRKSHQNWQQGVVLGEFEENGNAFELSPVRFRHTYRCRVGGTELSA